MDPVTEISKQRIALLYPGLRPDAIKVCQDVFRITQKVINVSQGIRSMDDQLAIYAKGRQLVDGKWVIVNKAEVVTNARPGLSWHCYGLAFDVSFAGEDPYLKKETQKVQQDLWAEIGRIGKAYGFTWGGDFHLVNGVSDVDHLERAYGLSLDQAWELFEANNLAGVWAYLDAHRKIPVAAEWNVCQPSSSLK